MRCLVITVLDMQREPNQRTQYVARMLGGIAHETVVFSKIQNTDRAWPAMARAALVPAVRRAEYRPMPLIRLWMVNPPLNYPHALAGGLVQGALVQGALVQGDAAAGRVHLLRPVLAALLSAVGILRDVLIVPSLLAAVLWRTRGRFDICVVEGPWSGAAGWLLKKLGRVDRLVYDDIDHVAGGQWLALRRWYVHALEHAVMRRADLVVSAGYLLGALRRRHTGRPVRVIPNGVDPAVFATARTKRPHPPTLVYMGHLAPFCGIDLAVRALPLLRAQVPDARLIIIGDGDPGYVAALRQLAEAGGVREAVVMTGRVPYDGLAHVLAECDIGLATFRTSDLGKHAFPLKLLEYMAAGLAVLCTRDTEADELIRRYPAGRAIRFDAQELAAAAAELLQRPDVYARATVAGQLAVQRYTWERALTEQREAILNLFTPADRRRLFLQRT